MTSLLLMRLRRFRSEKRQSGSGQTAVGAAAPKQWTKAILILIGCGSILNAHAGLTWKTYVNKDYGYSIPIPANLQLMPWKGDPVSPWQARTKTFESKDGNVSLVISTHWTNGITLQQRFSDEIDSRIKEGANVNYSVIKDNWFVVSGTNSLGFEFYTKLVVFGDVKTGETRYIYFTFAYPTSQRAIYDAAVTKMSHEFVPALPGDYDRE
jgi:hypothetical protein